MTLTWIMTVFLLLLLLLIYVSVSFARSRPTYTHSYIFMMPAVFRHHSHCSLSHSVVDFDWGGARSMWWLPLRSWCITCNQLVDYEWMRKWMDILFIIACVRWLFILSRRWLGCLQLCMVDENSMRMSIMCRRGWLILILVYWIVNWRPNQTVYY